MRGIYVYMCMYVYVLMSAIKKKSQRNNMRGIYVYMCMYVCVLMPAIKKISQRNNNMCGMYAGY